MHFTTIFIWFVLYSILGWIYETIFCSVKTLKWDNRGMLIGPYCPIYGVGAVLDVLVGLQPSAAEYQRADLPALFSWFRGGRIDRIVRYSSLCDTRHRRCPPLLAGAFRIVFDGNFLCGLRTNRRLLDCAECEAGNHSEKHRRSDFRTVRRFD